MGRWFGIFTTALVCVGTAAAAAAQAGQPATEGRGRGAVAQEFAPLGGSASGEAIGSGSMAQTLAALAVVIGLVVVCAVAYRWIASRSGGLAGQLVPARAPAGIIEVLGRYPLGRGQALVLLKLDRRVLLVSQTAGARVGAPPTMQTLCEVNDPDEVAAIVAKAAPKSERFAETFERFAINAPSSQGSVPAANAGVEIVDLTRTGGFGERLGRWIGGRA